MRFKYTLLLNEIKSSKSNLCSHFRLENTLFGNYLALTFKHFLHCNLDNLNIETVKI